MSIETALNNIHLRAASRWAHTEYSLEYHRDYLARRTGAAADNGALFQRAYDHLEYDFLWSTNDGLVNWDNAGRVTDMGHASYAADGSDQRDSAVSPFQTVEEVRTIIPRYAELWKPIHRAGKKVLFCSDGNFTEFAADVAAAGADGFIFEPCMDFGFMIDSFGQSHCLVGSYVDCRDLTFARWDKVRADIDKTLERLAGCRGAIIAVGNHLPANIPADMLDKYFAYLLPRLAHN